MSEEFSFKEGADVNGLIKTIGKQLADTIKIDPSRVKCKGMKIFYVDDTDILMASGLYVKGFHPDDYDE